MNCPANNKEVILRRFRRTLFHHDTLAATGTEALAKFAGSCTGVQAKMYGVSYSDDTDARRDPGGAIATSPYKTGMPELHWPTTCL